jgi:uncharacterized protein YjbJ (UPF0337 family)
VPKPRKINMQKMVICASAAMISVALLSGGAVAQGTTDKIEGTAKELRGSVKETIGKATGDPKLELEGKIDKVEGGTQNAVGDIKNTGGEIKDKLTK